METYVFNISSDRQ